jgi:hypothetical protein
VLRETTARASAASAVALVPRRRKRTVRSSTFPVLPARCLRRRICPVSLPCLPSPSRAPSLARELGTADALLRRAGALSLPPLPQPNPYTLHAKAAPAYAQ